MYKMNSIFQIASFYKLISVIIFARMRKSAQQLMDK